MRHLLEVSLDFLCTDELEESLFQIVPCRRLVASGTCAHGRRVERVNSIRRSRYGKTANEKSTDKEHNGQSNARSNVDDLVLIHHSRKREDQLFDLFNQLILFQRATRFIPRRRYLSVCII